MYMENNEQNPNLQPSNIASVPKQSFANNRAILIVLVSLVVLLIGIVFFFVYKYYDLKKQLDNEQLTSSQLTEVIDTPTPIKESSVSIGIQNLSLKTYTNEKYGFSFDYPESWSVVDDGSVVSFSNMPNGHSFSIKVWNVTGFGYCYKYNEHKEIVVDGVKSETADGIGGVDMCTDNESFINTGNTFVFIPLGFGDASNNLSVHLDYYYPLDDLSLAKSNLDQVVSTFKFLNRNQIFEYGEGYSSINPEIKQAIENTLKSESSVFTDRNLFAFAVYKNNNDEWIEARVVAVDEGWYSLQGYPNTGLLLKKTPDGWIGHLQCVPGYLQLVLDFEESGYRSITIGHLTNDMKLILKDNPNAVDPSCE